MISQIDKQTLDFLCKKKLTFNQFCMCLMLYHNDVSGMLRYSNEIGYLSGGTVIKPNGREVKELDDLVARGFLVFDEKMKNETHAIDNYSLTPKFTAGFLDQWEDKAKAFWAAYPANIMISGELKPYGKSVDYEEFKDKYVKIIKADPDVHSRALTDVTDRFRITKVADMGIMNYIGSSQWDNQTNATTKPKARFY